MSQQSRFPTAINPDGAAILDVERGSISMLNTTGSYIWQGLQRGESISSIAGSLALTTGESSLAVMRDVEDFVDELKHRGLISE